MIDRLREHSLAEVDVSNREHGRRHQLKCSREVREAQENDSGTGVVAIGMGKGEHPEEEVVISWIS